MSKYGFGQGIELPETTAPARPRPKIGAESVKMAVQAGSELGFINREPATRLKPGPKRTEPQDKVSIPGPKRVVDDFRNFCRSRNLTLWQGLAYLLDAEKGRDG
ncbi:hypothetical protein [Puniceibacterium confluentis]|uniref:hypothetical protein n=1 Tax=Puniceibacterium confluentis TaxID=1958944 RepID=UPI0011B67A46|nr:hypothetical protein [Puniceibacterium confluentis]